MKNFKKLNLGLIHILWLVIGNSSIKCAIVHVSLSKIYCLTAKKASKLKNPRKMGSFKPQTTKDSNILSTIYR